MELGEKLQLGIAWIPGHQGIEGNEVADTSFSKTICYSLLKCSLEYAKQKINIILRNQWDSDWKQSRKGLWTKKLFPSVNLPAHF